MRNLDTNPRHHFEMITGAKCYKGQLLSLSGTTAIPTAAATASAILLGLAVETAESGAIVTIDPIDPSALLEIPVYQSATKKTFEAADKGKIYDINVSSNVQTINLDDTTNAFLVCVGYKADNSVGYFKPLRSVCYI